MNLNIIKTGDDADTLRKVEALIQADFINGLPPHLQPDAKSFAYAPGSNQSRIFVTSHSDFSSLNDRDIQKILRQRLILVHGLPFDYSYQWNLESFGRLYDIDKKITVHGELMALFQKPVLVEIGFSFKSSPSSEPRYSPSPNNIAGISCKTFY